MPAIAELRRLWSAGVSADAIAAHLGIRRQKLHELRRLHGIPDRPNKFRRRPEDPTPEEIEERKRECRERRPPDEQGPGRVEIKQFHFDGRAFLARSFS